MAINWHIKTFNLVLSISIRIESGSEFRQLRFFMLCLWLHRHSHMHPQAEHHSQNMNLLQNLFTFTPKPADTESIHSKLTRRQKTNQICTKNSFWKSNFPLNIWNWVNLYRNVWKEEKLCDTHAENYLRK